MHLSLYTYYINITLVTGKNMFFFLKKKHVLLEVTVTQAVLNILVLLKHHCSTKHDWQLASWKLLSLGIFNFSNCIVNLKFHQFQLFHFYLICCTKNFNNKTDMVDLNAPNPNFSTCLKILFFYLWSKALRRFFRNQ